MVIHVCRVRSLVKKMILLQATACIFLFLILLVLFVLGHLFESICSLYSYILRGPFFILCACFGILFAYLKKRGADLFLSFCMVAFFCILFLFVIIFVSSF